MNTITKKLEIQNIRQIIVWSVLALTSVVLSLPILFHKNGLLLILAAFTWNQLASIANLKWNEHSKEVSMLHIVFVGILFIVSLVDIGKLNSIATPLFVSMFLGVINSYFIYSDSLKTTLIRLLVSLSVFAGAAIAFIHFVGAKFALFFVM